MSDTLIPSFSVDHTKIIPGIFVSRQDTVGDHTITTYDIRITRPNVEPAIDVAAMHTLEHIIATYLRNNDEWKDKVIYWGPMGCLTGFYLILKGDLTPEDIYPLIVDAFASVEAAKTVPGSTAINCGNSCMHNLTVAKWWADAFHTYLEINNGDPDIFNYPKTDRPVTTDGDQFYDS